MQEERIHIMPSEERSITFNLDEVHKALLVTLAQQGEEELPTGRLVSMNLEGDDKTIGVHLEDKQGEMKEMHFDRLLFAKALVIFCQGCGIPLPRDSKKTLHVLEDRITLHMELDSQYPL